METKSKEKTSTFVHDRIVQLCNHYDKSFAQLSRELDKQRTYISTLINEKRSTQLKTIGDIAECFGLSLSEFFSTDLPDLKKIEMVDAVYKKVTPEKIEDFTYMINKMDENTLNGLIADYNKDKK